MTSIKFFVGTFLALVLVVTSTPAATAYSSYQTNSDRIAELQETILRLQAELARLQGGSWGVGSGVVTTGSALETSRGDVEFRGSARPQSAQSAKVWFEFGPTRSLSYSTPKLTLRNSSNVTRNFTGYAYDLDRGTYYYRAVLEDSRGNTSEGAINSFVVSGGRSSWYDYDYDDYDYDWDDWDDEDTPEVTTDDADDVTESRAELSGEVDMNDSDNGIVFFVYGEDEDMVEEAADENEYNDIDTDGDDLRLVRVASNFDDSDDFFAVVSGLDNDTDHYFRICVEYEDEDNDERLECGDVEEFTTD